MTLGLVPLNLPGLNPQSCKNVFTLVVANIKETLAEMKIAFADVLEELRDVRKNGIQLEGENFRRKVLFMTAADLKSMLAISGTWANNTTNTNPL